MQAGHVSMLDTCGWLGIAAILTPLADSDILIVSHFVCNQTHVFLTGWQLGAVSCVLEEIKYIFECTPDSLQRYAGCGMLVRRRPNE